MKYLNNLRKSVDVINIKIEAPCSKLQGIFDRKEVCYFQIRSLTPQQAAENALAFAVQKSFGFTLLEILISIFIFAIIVTTVFGSYNFVLSNSKTVDKAISSYQMGQNCLNRMIVDLESIHVCLPPAYSPPDFDDPPDTYRIVGDISDIDGTGFSRLRFTSLAHVPIKHEPQSNIPEIVYYVEAVNENDFVLRRADNMCSDKPFEEERSDPVLCENVKSLTFIYYDQEGAEYENWDSDLERFGHATPVAIGIKLEIGNDSDSQLFETMVAIPVNRKITGK